MDRTPVKSSVVASKGYNPITRSMEVEFTNGTIGNYIDVPMEWSSWFDTEPSAGSAIAVLRKAGVPFEQGEK